ncbi:MULTISPECIES: hypothetical protein [unclassified Nonomuraea]|uniref:hypothetical protein n=1 Tax=Nonomuraea sp. NPDC047529 TaxID=3155623 RepID=UPI0033F6111E
MHHRPERSGLPFARLGNQVGGRIDLRHARRLVIASLPAAAEAFAVFEECRRLDENPATDHPAG